MTLWSGRICVSTRRNFKLLIEKHVTRSLSRKKTPLDKEYNEEVLGGKVHARTLA